MGFAGAPFDPVPVEPDGCMIANAGLWGMKGYINGIREGSGVKILSF